MARQITKQCPSCDRLFRSRRDAKTCSERCRKRLQRVKAAAGKEALALKRTAESVLQSAENTVKNLESTLAAELSPVAATEAGFVGDGQTTAPPPPLPASPVAPPTPSAPPLASLATPVTSAPASTTFPLTPPTSSSTPLATPVLPPSPDTMTPASLSLAAEAHLPHIPPPAGSVVQPLAQPTVPQATLTTSPTVPITPPGPQPEAPALSPSPSVFSSPPVFSLQSLSSNDQPLAGNKLTATPQPEPTAGQLPPPPVATSALKTSWSSWFRANPYTVAFSFFLLVGLAGGGFGLSRLSQPGPGISPSPVASQLSLISSQADQAISTDTTSSFLTLNLDTLLAKGKQLTLGQLVAGPDSGILQLTGDFQASGTLGASGGSTFANNSGLVLNNITVCTPAGCIPNVAINPVTGPSGLTNPIATPVEGSTLNPANVALLDGTGPQTFTGNNRFNGIFLAQNSTNSTTAFVIQNAAGTSNLLIANTLSSRIGIGTATPAYTLDVAGDINSTTAVRVNGALLCNAAGCTAAGGSNNYVQNGLALQSANFNIQSAATTSVTATIRAATGQTADLLQLKDQAGVNLLSIGPTGNTLIRPSANSINAFSVQNAAGTSLLIGGDTLNARVAIATSVPPNYTLDVGGDINTSTGLRVNGNLVCSTVCSPGSGSSNYIQNGTTVQTANYAIQSNVGTSVVAYIRGASGQTADLLDVVGIGAGNAILPVATFGSSGNILFQNAVNSTTAFQLQNLAGNNYILVNTAGASLSLGDAGIASNVQIGNTTGAVAQTINIGSNTTAASTSTVVLGSTIGTSATTIESGSGNLAIGNGATAHTIAIGSGAAVQGLTIGSTNSTSATTINSGTGALNVGNDTVTKTTTINIGAEATGADLVALGSAHASSTLILESGTAATALQFGNGATAHGIQIGSNATGDNDIVLGGANAGSTLTLEAGTAATAIQIGNGATAHGIQIGTGGAVQTIVLGSTNTTSTTTIQGGTGAGAIALTQGSGGSITIGGTAGAAAVSIQCGTGTCGLGNNATDHSTTIGSTTGTSLTALQGGTGGINIGTANVAQTIQIGNTANAVAQTINIGNNATAASTSTVVLGSTTGTSTTTIQGGTGNINLNPAGASGAVIVKPGTDNTTAFQVQNAAGTSNLLVADTTNTRIGIGTAGPAGTFHVRSANDARVTPQFTVEDAHATSGITSIELKNSATVAAQRNWGIANGYDENGGLSIRQSNNNTNLGTATTGTTRLMIDSEGDLGIGSTAPGIDTAGWVAGTRFVTFQGPTAASNPAIFQIGRNIATDDEVLGAIDFFNLANNGGGGSGRYNVARIQAVVNDADSSGSTGGAHLLFVTKSDTGTTDERMRITDTGNVGIGTTAPVQKLHVSGSINIDTSGSSTPGNGGGLMFGPNDAAASTTWLLKQSTNTVATQSTSNLFIDNYNGAWNNRFSILAGGNVGIGTTGPESKVQISGGGLCVGSDANCNTDNNTEGIVYSSSTAMTLYDLAENYPTNDHTLVPAEIVALDKERGVFVKRAASAADNLIGVISEKPGVLLGGFNGAQFKDERQVAVALSGRVPVKVSLEGGPIRIGDRITASSTPGVGMKASSSSQSVGIALGDFDGSQEDQETVMVFINISNGSRVAETLQGGDPVVDSLLASGALRAETLTVAGNATFRGTITLAGHVITEGQSPAAMIEAGAGDSATVQVDGNDQSGTVTVTAGAVPTAGSLAKLVFHQAYSKAPRVVLTPANDQAAALQYYYNADAQSFTVKTNIAPTPSTAYAYTYWVVQ